MTNIGMESTGGFEPSALQFQVPTGFTVNGVEMQLICDICCALLPKDTGRAERHIEWHDKVG